MRSANRSKKAYRNNWKPKHQIVWESNFGKIPEKCQVIFLDGDHSNFNLSNLALIKLKYMGHMSRNKWFASKEPDVITTGIMWCEFNEIVSDVLKGE